MKINYLIATWSGPRHSYNSTLPILKCHLNQLQLLKHNIDQITIGYPYYRFENKEYTNYLYNLECKGKLSNGTKVELMRVNNYGFSYGQYGKIFRRYRKQFDHYIICEDDYIPVIDNFDTILVNLIKERNVGYLCGLCLDETGTHNAITPRHAAISNGIINASCLEATLNKYGIIPSISGDNQPTQIVFSQAIIKSNQTIDDYISTNEYRCLFWDHKIMKIYGATTTLKDIFVPYQHLINNTIIYEHIKR